MTPPDQPPAHGGRADLIWKRGATLLRVVFGHHERSLTIEGPPGPVIDAVRDMFASAQPTAGGASGPADLTVAETRAGFELRSRTDPEIQRFATADAVVVALEFGVAHFLLGAVSDRTHLHAAGAVVPAGESCAAVLALGPSGSGKSSLALAWSRMGLPLLGDDVVLLGDGGWLAHFARPVRVAADRLRAMRAPEPEPPLVDEGTREARYDPGDGGGWADGDARAAVVARIGREVGASVRVRALSSAEGLELLLGSVLDTGASPLHSFPRFADVLERARVVDVRFGDAAEGARALRELLR